MILLTTLTLIALLSTNAQAGGPSRPAPQQTPCPDKSDPAHGLRELKDYADVFTKQAGGALIRSVTVQANRNFGDPRRPSPSDPHRACRPLAGGQGKATHYDKGFVGRPTSMGYRYNVTQMTAAMPASAISRINIGDLRTLGIDPTDYIKTNAGNNSSQFATTLVVYNPVTNQSRKVVVTDKCGACRAHSNPVPTGATDSASALKMNKVEDQSAIIDLSPVAMRALTGNRTDTSTFVMLYYCPNIR